jgi:hypothetical protein
MSHTQETEFRDNSKRTWLQFKYSCICPQQIERQFMKLPVKYDDIHYTEKWKVRNAYVEQQDGKCYYCKGDLKEEPPKEITDKKIKPKLYPPQFFEHPIHLHHSHTTGLTLGAVHNYCNAVLWEYHGE